MTVNAAKVKQIIEAGGTLWFSAVNGTKVANKIVKNAQRGDLVDDYFDAKVELGESEVIVKGLPNHQGANAVNVVYRPQYATFADLEAPGYVYSDSFGGCVFYLYRGPLGYIHAVHATRRDGKLADPTQYFKARGGKLLYKWDSLGQMTNQELLNYEVGTVFACIGRDRIDVFAFTTKDKKVKRLIEHRVIDNWVTHEEAES